MRAIGRWALLFALGGGVAMLVTLTGANAQPAAGTTPFVSPRIEVSDAVDRANVYARHCSAGDYNREVDSLESRLLKARGDLLDATNRANKQDDKLNNVWREQERNLQDFVRFFESEMRHVKPLNCGNLQDSRLDLMRPGVEMNRLPMPDRFCSEQELAKFKSAVDAEIRDAANTVKKVDAYLDQVAQTVIDLRAGKLTAKGSLLGPMAATDKTALAFLAQETRWGKATINAFELQQERLNLQARAALMSTVQDCNEKVTSRAHNQDPRLALDRPFFELEDPKMPDRFCTESDREAFIARIEADLRQTNDAWSDLLDYREDVEGMLEDLLKGDLNANGVALQPDDPVAFRFLRQELQWQSEQATINEELAKHLIEMRSAARLAKLANCSSAAPTPGQAAAPRESERGVPPPAMKNIGSVMQPGGAAPGDASVLEGLKRPTWAIPYTMYSVPCADEDIKIFLAEIGSRIPAGKVAQTALVDYLQKIESRTKDLLAGTLVIGDRLFDPTDQQALAALKLEKRWAEIQQPSLNVFVLGAERSHEAWTKSLNDPSRKKFPTCPKMQVIQKLVLAPPGR
jgi:hypothetical protein